MLRTPQRSSTFRTRLAGYGVSACALTVLMGAANVVAGIPLGSAQSFGVLAASTVTNTGSTIVTGSVGISPGSAIVGFPPGIATGTMHVADAPATQAQSDLAGAYNAAAAMPCTVDLTGQDLGGLTLAPGVYCFSSSAQLTGTLTLDAQGNPDATFVFRIGSTLTTAGGSSVSTINGTSCNNATWLIGSSATLGAGSTFGGDVLAFTSITMTTGASTAGRLLARNGAVTLDGNSVNTCAVAPPLDQQIQALIDEKASRNAIQQKLDSQFMLMLYPQKFVALPNLQNRPTLDPDGSVGATVHLNDGADLTAIATLLGQLQIPVLGSSALDATIRARIPLEQLEAVAAFASVRFIDRDRPAVHNKDTTSEGDKAHRAEFARATYGYTGAGQKVCVISDGIDSVASRQPTGDLPPSIYVLPGQAGSGDEGTAMLEIVFDLAPDATLGFATSRGGEAKFAQNILDLADPAKGACNIIVDDTDYVTESPFQDGVIATAVNTATASGVLYFSSAGNSGNLDSGMSGTWEGDFSAPHDLRLAQNATNVMHEFAPNVTSNAATSPSARVFIHWADAAGRASTDYDLYVLDPDGRNVIAFSTTTQNGSQTAFEYTEAAAPNSFSVGSRIVVAKPAGQADRMFNLQWFRGTLGYATSGATRGHSAAENAISVAATPAAQPYGLTPTGPYPNAFTASAKVEVFSSDGPRRIFFDMTGNLLAGAVAGNFTSTGGKVRQKPDLTAADGVKTDTPGYVTFYGTSAAAPHAAAIAALVRQKSSSSTAAQLRAKLMASTIGISSGARSAGAGVLMASSALQPVVAATGGLDVDGNGQYDALTDGVLVLRWLFGLTGQPLVAGAIGNAAQRSLPADILGWLEPRRPSFDVDANNNIDALTDGLMILRYLFGLRGAALVNGAMGSNPGRASAPAIEAYILSLTP